MLIVVTLLFAVGSLGYYLARYLHLTYTADPAVRTLNVEGTMDQVGTCLENQREQIEDILPTNSRYLFSSGRLIADETTIDFSLCLAGSSANTTLPLDTGQFPDFTKGNGALIPHHITTPTGERMDTSRSIGSDLVVFIHIYTLDPLTGTVQIKERQQFSVEIAGTYDETKIVTNENTIFIAAALVSEWNVLSQQALFPDSPMVEQCDVIVRQPQTVEKIKQALQSQGFTVHAVYTWNSAAIAGGFVVGLLFLLIGLSAFLGLNHYFCRQMLVQAKREIRQLALLGQQITEIQKIFFSHYALLMAGVFPVAAFLSQPLLAPLGETLLDGYFMTGVVNLFTFFLLLAAVISVFFTMKRQIPLITKYGEGLDDGRKV